MAKPIIIDVLIAIPITILFVLFITKFIEIITNEDKAEDKIKKNLIISFIIGIIGILCAWFIFYKSKVKNRSVMISLILGSLYLIGNSLFLNWNKLSNDSKLFMIGSVLVGLIVISYV